MYLFSRSAVLTGNPAAAMPWAVKIGEYVSTTTGRPLSTWAAQFGRPLGTVTWSTILESHADLNAAFGALESDAGYARLVEEGMPFFSSPHEMTLRQPLHGGPTPGGEPPAVGALANVTTAVAANGKMAEAFAWGIAVSEHVEKVTGNPVTFMSDAYGAFGQLTWLGTSPDLEAVDAANAKLAADAGYMDLLGQSGDLFVPGSGHQALFARIG